MVADSVQAVMIDDYEKDLSVLGNPNYRDPVYKGFGYLETAAMRVWNHPAGYSWSEKFLLLEGMKCLSFSPSEKETINLLQLVCMYRNYND